MRAHVANGDHPTTWLEILRDWMPGLVALLSAIFGFLIAGIRWLLLDRKRFINRLRQNSERIDQAIRAIERMEEMDGYPDRTTTQRLARLRCDLQDVSTDLTHVRDSAIKKTKKAQD
jgi:hypothetical protein